MRNQKLQIWIQIPVDQTRYAVLDVTLCHQTCLVGVVAVTYRSIGVGHLEDLEAFKLEGVVRKWNQRIYLLVVQVLVVLAFAVAQHDHQLTVQFLNLHIRSIGTVQDLETVIEQVLGLIVRNQNLLYRREKIRLVVVTLPNHTRGDKVQGAWSQGEGTCVVQTALVF